MIKQQGSSAVWGGQAKANGRYQQSQSQSQRQTQQVVQNQNQNRARTSNEFACGRNGRPLGLSPSAWPPLQQAQQQQQPPPQNLHNGSAMRAVFLANPGGRKESAGTGVFLPRRVDSPSDTRRKPGPSSLSLLITLGFCRSQICLLLRISFLSDLVMVVSTVILLIILAKSLQGVRLF